MKKSPTHKNLAKAAYLVSRNTVSTGLALAFGCFAFSDAGYAACSELCDNTNLAEGYNAFPAFTSGAQNTALGSNALASDAEGVVNTAVGWFALSTNVSGTNNTAMGDAALARSNASFNTAVGSGALENDRSGEANTAAGFTALGENDIGSDNTATGYQALATNSSGSQNTATGFDALVRNTTAGTNTATGFNALFSNTSGPVNTATGAYALYSNTTGQSNVATGVDALYHNQAGHDNTAEGNGALLNSKGSNNTALGSNAGQNLTTGNNNIIIGANVLGNTGDANVTRIGNTTQKKAFIGGIYGKTVASGVGVIVNSSGQLGTIQSSSRFKDNIKPMDKTSEAILALKPVTFRYKEELDPDKTPQFGLIAEEVEKVNPDLVVRDEDGKISTVRYEAVNAMLLNEFLKEHRRVDELQAAGIAERKEIAELNQQLKAQAAAIQKMRAQFRLSKSTSQTVAETR